LGGEGKGQDERRGEGHKRGVGGREERRGNWSPILQNVVAPLGVT